MQDLKSDIWYAPRTIFFFFFFCWGGGGGGGGVGVPHAPVGLGLRISLSTHFYW